MRREGERVKETAVAAALGRRDRHYKHQTMARDIVSSGFEGKKK